MTHLTKIPGQNGQLNHDDIYRLRLYITGATPNSTRAVANIKALCEANLPGKYELEIIDVYQQPLIAEREQLIALPMLLKTSPGVPRRLIGDMADTAKVLRGLNLSAT